MSSSIVYIIICIAAIAMKAYLKKEGDAFDANKPGQIPPPPPSSPEESLAAEEAEDDVPQVSLEELIRRAPHKETAEEQAVAEPQATPAASEAKRKPHAPQEEDTPSLQEAEPTPPESKDEYIRLNTPEEARRAFIYSEIFSRKYE